ncbi:MAG: twin-arginine translocase subunit TatB [Alphaproteobacteria bacterium]|nr:twin-arginine translocase subunit TatB [Alphaproteobacteria bacterium]
MNPGIGAPELIVLAVLALIVVGPKDLPMMFRRVGRFAGQARQMARDFQRSFDDMGREAEMSDLRREIEALKSGNPVAKAKRDLDEVTRDLASLEHETVVERKLAAAEKDHSIVSAKKPSAKEDIAPSEPQQPTVEPYQSPKKKVKKPAAEE